MIRRQFLKLPAGLAGAAGYAMALPEWFAPQEEGATARPKPLTANDKPGIALIGCGSRGNYLLKQVAPYGEVLAICDVDDSRREKTAAGFPGTRSEKDFRRVLERNDIHVIVNATPDHWHTLINMTALKAGKDVYAEKPLTLTVDEGRRLTTTVSETGRILQTGSQQRSSNFFRTAVELVRNKRIGTLQHIVVGLPKAGWGGPFPASAPPAGLDWNFWLGQAPQVPYVRQRCHHQYRHWYDYSSGPLTDWGCHHNDIALWALGMDRGGPLTVQGMSHLDPVPGGYDVHSQVTVKYTYANGVTHTCVPMWTKQFGDTPLVVPTSIHNGLLFQGSTGWIAVGREKLEASVWSILEPLPASAERVEFSADHTKNFFDCVRSRKQPASPAEIGHRAASLGHIGAISVRLGGRPLRWDAVKERFIGDEEANGYLAREQRKPYSYDRIA